MAKHTNAASRLHRLLEAASQTNAGPGASQQVWAHIFGLDQTQNIYTTLAVMERILWMQGEVEAIQAGMSDQHYSETLYASQLSRVLNLLNPMSLGADVRQLREGITPDILAVVAFCSEILPDEEDEIDTAELDAIRNLATELEALIEAGDVPHSLRSMLRHHVELIHRALARYPVSGATALREAMYTGVGEIVVRREEVQANGESPGVVKALTLWAKVNKVTDAVIKADKLLQIGQKVIDVIHSLGGSPPGA